MGMCPDAGTERDGSYAAQCRCDLEESTDALCRETPAENAGEKRALVNQFETSLFDHSNWEQTIAVDESKNGKR